YIRRPRRPPHQPSAHSPGPSSAPLRRLSPRPHAKHQHLPEGPHPIRQPSSHRWRPWLPLLGGATPVGRQGLRQRLAYAGMGQTEIIVHMIQDQLLAYTILTLAERGDTTSHRRHRLTDGQVEALHEGRVDLPAMRGQHLLDRLQRAEDHAVRDVDQAPPAYCLDHLRIEQPRQRHPAGLEYRTFVLAAWWLRPLAEMGEERGGVLLEAVRQEEWYTAGRQHLHDLMHHALRHGKRAVADVDRQQQFRHGVDGRPDPVRRA